MAETQQGSQSVGWDPHSPGSIHNCPMETHLAQCLPSRCVRPSFGLLFPGRQELGALCCKPSSMAVVNGLILSDHHLLLKQNGDVTHSIVKTGAAGLYEAPVKANQHVAHRASIHTDRPVCERVELLLLLMVCVHRGTDTSMSSDSPGLITAPHCPQGAS